MRKTVLRSLLAFVLVFVMFAAVVPPMDASASGTVYVVGCEEWVSLRSRPSTSATALREVPLYSSVTYRGDAGSGFSKVTYNGITGYILTRYLDYMEPQVAERAMTVVNCRQSITLRSKPSTQAAEILQIPLGATVYRLYWKYHPDFYLVNYNGLTGFALKSYLR